MLRLDCQVMFQKVLHRVRAGSSGVTVGMEIWCHTLSSVILWSRRCFHGNASLQSEVQLHVSLNFENISLGHQVLLSVFRMNYNLINHTLMDHHLLNVYCHETHYRFSIVAHL